MKVRTRFAPSPTGHLHIGSIRTALYSWLFARNQKGKFILRFEDTDLSRSNQKVISSIIDCMNWLNLTWDEGPYFQSKRFNRYNEIINKMLSNGKAYKCYCSRERLDSLRRKQVSERKKPRYDRYCRYNHTFHPENELNVVRFVNPEKGSVVFHDQIRGWIEFNNEELDDLIIRRTNGFPTYNFCVVIDDWDMKITHVIRGEEHINNTPRQINILKALNAPIPIYSHIPTICGKDGKKLSKRYNSVNVIQYREDGFLPEALLNYLVRLGWSSGNKEIFNREEMIELFSLNSVKKSPSIFDIKKLLWINHYYINLLSEDTEIYIKKYIEKKINVNNGPSVKDLIKISKGRFKTLKEMIENFRYFYEEFEEFDIHAVRKYFCSTTSKLLSIIHSKLTTIDEWTIENIHSLIQNTSNELKIKISEINMPIRIAITGSSFSPPLKIVMYTIGKFRCISRIEKALNFIKVNKEILKNENSFCKREKTSNLKL